VKIAPDSTATGQPLKLLDQLRRCLRDKLYNQGENAGKKAVIPMATSPYFTPFPMGEKNA